MGEGDSVRVKFKNGRYLTTAAVAVIKRRYPHVKTSTLSEQLGCSIQCIYRKVQALGLRKTEKYLASPDACRLRRGDNVGESCRFSPGHVPANKGLRRPGWHSGRMRETQFKKGVKPPTWLPIGSYRKTKEGYLQRKVTDTGYPPRDWQAEHRLLWAEQYGEMPPGYAVKFIDGDKANVAIGNLCLVSRRDLALLNNIWRRYPRELAEVIQLRGALKRKINRRVHDEKQVTRFTQSSVRCP